MEERYTQEAVLADQRVSGLKQEAANLHEQLKATSHQGALQRYICNGRTVHLLYDTNGYAHVV